MAHGSVLLLSGDAADDRLVRSDFAVAFESAAQPPPATRVATTHKVSHATLASRAVIYPPARPAALGRTAASSRHAASPSCVPGTRPARPRSEPAWCRPSRPGSSP